jgi:hypothetical protein
MDICAAAYGRNRRAGERRRVVDRLFVKMKTQAAKTLRAFLIELVVYAILVIAYFLFVLHFLGESLHWLELHHRYAYGGVAILLIIGQAVVLEGITTFLLRLFSGRSE